MNDRKKKPVLVGYVALFAPVYLALLFLAGLAKRYLKMDIGGNGPVLVAAGIIIAYVFIIRNRRNLTGAEVVKLSLGAFAVDIVYQIGFALLLTPDHAWLSSWVIWFILGFHLLGLFFIFGVIARIMGNSAIKAMEKKAHNNPSQFTE